MADNALTTNRRSFLSGSAAIVGAASLASIPSSLSAQAGPSRWEAVCAAYAQADRAVNDYDRDFLRPASNRFTAWRSQYPSNANIGEMPHIKADYDAASALYDPVQERFDALVDARSDALDALLLCPAPNVLAVTYKAEVIVADARWDCNDFGEVMGQMLTDLRRFSSN